MSSTGNRSHPNSTRVDGLPEEKPQGGAAGAPKTGSHQESRDHHKHNNPGQDGHKPQKHTPDQEKH